MIKKSYQKRDKKLEKLTVKQIGNHANLNFVMSMRIIPIKELVCNIENGIIYLSSEK